MKIKRFLLTFLVIVFGLLVISAIRLQAGKSLNPDSLISENAEEGSVGVISDYFPLNIGNTWEYEGVRKEDVGGGKIETENIKKKIEVSDIKNTKNGVLVILNNSKPFKYLINGDSINFDPDFPENKNSLLTFPLYVGQKFGDVDSLRYRDDNAYVNFVEEKLTLEILGKIYDECFRITHKTVPDKSYKIFCYGIGIVEEGYKHNGTVFEWTYKLTNYNFVEPIFHPQSNVNLRIGD